MEDYNDIIDQIRPRREIKASASLRARTEKLIAAHARRRKLSRWIFGIATSVAAAVAVVFFMLPFRMSAMEILESALEVMKGENAVEMTLEVRTVPTETFGYISPEADFVAHDIISVRDSVISWRVSNGSRMAVGIGGDIYYWLSGSACGWTGYDSPRSVLGSLDIFLSPESVLEAELRLCGSQKGARYSVEEKDGEYLLTVHATPQGNMENPYLLDTSIPSSENVRRYVIDAATRRLRHASVCIVDATGAETEVLRLSSIDYDSRAEVVAPPQTVVFSVIDSLSGALAESSPVDVAKKIFAAFGNWDKAFLETVIYPAEVDMYRDTYEGVELIETGEAFTSGNYPGVFVPYRIRLRDGKVKEWNIALVRSDSGGWIVDGGL